MASPTCMNISARPLSSSTYVWRALRRSATSGELWFLSLVSGRLFWAACPHPLSQFTLWDWRRSVAACGLLKILLSLFVCFSRWWLWLLILERGVRGADDKRQRVNWGTFAQGWENFLQGIWHTATTYFMNSCICLNGGGKTNKQNHHPSSSSFPPNTQFNNKCIALSDHGVCCGLCLSKTK